MSPFFAYLAFFAFVAFAGYVMWGVTDAVSRAVDLVLPPKPPAPKPLPSPETSARIKAEFAQLFEAADR